MQDYAHFLKVDAASSNLDVPLMALVHVMYKFYQV